MEMKWLAIMMVGIMGTAMVGLGVEKYQQGQCRVAAINRNMVASEIEKVCGK